MDYKFPCKKIKCFRFSLSINKKKKKLMLFLKANNANGISSKVYTHYHAIGNFTWYLRSNPGGLFGNLIIQAWWAGWNESPLFSWRNVWVEADIIFPARWAYWAKGLPTHTHTYTPKYIDIYIAPRLTSPIVTLATRLPQSLVRSRH